MTRLPIVALAIAASTVLVAAQERHDHPANEKLGSVHFQTSCAAPAQPLFDRAVALLHSFDFGRAIDGFNSALKEDPSCVIAYWGIALSRWSNPFAAGVKPPAQLQLGRDAIVKAETIASGTTRERDYIDAASKLYADFERTPQPARVAAYREAMGAIASRYPTDEEAQIFHALALAFSADPIDKTYANQITGGRMLEKLFARHPDHPGLAHYIIHAYDYPPLAERALEAARRYATIAPSAPHALHMPSHTFTRIGYWQESIDANVASAATAKREGVTAEELHASDYQTYAYLQTGQDIAARQLVAALPAMASRFDPSSLAGAAPPSAGFFAIAAIPARYALERGVWAEAVALGPKTSPFPYADAMTWFARAIGAGRLGRPATIRESIDALEKIRERLEQSGEAYWAEQIEIQRRGAAAWLAFVEGRRTDAIAQMRAAAEREDATEKNAITPGPLAPARELLGEMLRASQQPALALKEFEATLRKEPDRFRALAGAAGAADAAGDKAAARKHYERLLHVAARADTPGRPELVEARRVVTPNGAR